MHCRKSQNHWYLGIIDSQSKLNAKTDVVESETKIIAPQLKCVPQIHADNLNNWIFLERIEIMFYLHFAQTKSNHRMFAWVGDIKKGAGWF